ncbi:4-alpha-glucanotransferase [Sphingomonas sp. AP4-R1]|uniref:4-alpha-glucanotransferase n=1 Tax=Sphingomonas sp. AP4-R1 TaxID=2735134 RepID=UPI00149344E0|nr:4-alpha-glucanotransferase [Sphingomonas sp. AP4-R1]QJU59190.1 4-alpha-glucanotransferase [Sphingomonas sp. AP4-R1]
MSDAAVLRLAKAAGILVDWEDATGGARRVSIGNLRAILSGLGFGCESAGQCDDSIIRLETEASDHCRIIDAGARLVGLSGRGLLHFEDGRTLDLDLDDAPVVTETGYHELDWAGGVLPVIVAPQRGQSVPTAGPRPWGLSVQIYSLVGDGAFGDFRALADFAVHATRVGADAVMLSPVHALFTTDPGRYSPYSPSSRSFLNPWYGDPGGVPPLPSTGDLIDWPAAVAAKLTAFRQAYARAGSDPAFLDYVAHADNALTQHALFDALYAHFFTSIGARGWQAWPAEFRQPGSSAVAAFAREQAEAIDFHMFLQWRAEAGMAEAAQAAAGMRIGLVGDIAVGIDAGGSHAWARGDELMLGISIGAPPDAFQAAGQNWGITSFSPAALRAKAYRPFLDLLRGAMRYAGGVRIDHALGLRRLWLVPNGASPLDGAYLCQPEADLLRLIALESERNATIVIGEDLGVVPPGLREMQAERGLLGMRVLPFERDKGGDFRPPRNWDVASVAMTSTHDLPPVAGWWKGRDIMWRETLGAAGERIAERSDRALDRTRLWQACCAAGVAQGPEPAAETPAPAVDAAIGLVAKAASALAIVPIEDLVGLDEAPNLPGTVNEHPNWRRRLPASAEALFARQDVAGRVARIAEERET